VDDARGWAEDFERSQRDRVIWLAVSGIGLVISALSLVPQLAATRGASHFSAESLEFAIPFGVCVALAQIIVVLRRRAYARAKAHELPRATVARR